MPPAYRRVLIVGGSFAGLCCARDLATHYLVTIVDAKEYFEYTPGVLRAFVKPSHFSHLSFTLQPVIEGRMGCKYVWGEVKQLDGPNRTAIVKPMFKDEVEMIDFDFCIIAAGCNFGPFHKWGESLWFPTIHEAAIPEGSWPQFDERFIEGRKRHILDEYTKISALNQKKASILVVGAGFIGVEWATELQYYFPQLKLTIIDFLPQPLGPLPPGAARYCSKYMSKVGIKEHYSIKYDAGSKEFWQKIGFASARPDKEYVCIGVKASNYFMPTETLSEKGPGGGGWILMNMQLAVQTRDGQVWATDGKGLPRVFAIGDCNYSCIEEPGKKPDQWPIPPIPKISYPGEEEGVIAVTNLIKVDKMNTGGSHDCCGSPLALHDMHWPWGAGMFATSLGPNDACFVVGANWNKGSGWTVVWGYLCAWQKWFIEWSKTDECAYGFIGRVIWHFVHHTPVHLWGGGPKWGYNH